MNKAKRALVAIYLPLTACSLLLVQTSLVWSATQGIGLTPAIEEVVLDADQALVEFEINLSNTTEAPVDLELSVVDFGALDESGGIAFLGQSGQQAPYGLQQWMKPTQDRVRLEPGATSDVTVVITNDSSLAPGGHYGAVIVSAVAGQGGADSVAVVPAASTLVLLKKIGGEQYQLDLNELKANSSLIKLPESVGLKFKNTGNVHVVPRGTVTLTGPFNSVIARGAINESSAFVLPESNRDINVSLTNYKQPWLPGRYTLTTTWRYDGTEQTVVHVRYFWYAGKLAIYTIIVLSTLIVLIMYIRYRRRPPTRN